MLKRVEKWAYIFCDAINRNTLKEESVCGKRSTFCSGLNSIEIAKDLLRYTEDLLSFIDIYFTVAMVLRGVGW